MAQVARFRLKRSGLEATAAVRPHSLSLTFGSDRVYSFDLSGRLLSSFERGVYYRRGLDHSLIRKERRAGEYVVERIPADKAFATYERIYAPLIEAVEELASGLVDCGEYEESRRTVDSVLGAIASEPSDLAADAERFRRVYTPVAILPPDQYLALVLQVTEGCSYNRCRFCHFYRDRPFRVKGLPEFRQHLDTVIEYFGPGLSVRQSVFLADANALVAEPLKLEPMVEVIRDRFFSRSVAGFKPRGIYSFVDSFHTEFEDLDVWRRYRELGLRRVYMGVESGNDELLATMGKPSTASSTREAAEILKASGIELGAIVITGLGGRAYAERHVSDTIKLLNSLMLDGNDLVLFSPYVADYTGVEMEEFAPSLSEHECDMQRKRITAGLRFPESSEGPRMADYSLREFVY
jgi:radical SAM superfamily enzyme YgiQ (UPF0313 family)